MVCRPVSFGDLISRLPSLDGLLDRLFSFAGRVDIEGLPLKLVRLLLPVLSAPISCLLLRVSFPATVSRVFAALMVLSLREVLVRPIRLLELLVDDLGVVEPDDLLLLIGLPMREVLLWPIRLLELLLDDLDVVEPDNLLLLVGLTMREVLLWLIRLLELLLDDLGVVEPDDLLLLIGLPMREVLLLLI
ncbi:MAG: hypothetical protein ACYS32_11380 [Planctomycetota bacterium]